MKGLLTPFTNITLHVTAQSLTNNHNFSHNHYLTFSQNSYLRINVCDIGKVDGPQCRTKIKYEMIQVTMNQGLVQRDLHPHPNGQIRTYH